MSDDDAPSTDTDQGDEGEGTADTPADPLAAVAAAIERLTPADRAKLAAMLASSAKEREEL